MLDRAPMAMDCDEDAGFDPLRPYAETLDLLERLHRLCLEVIKDELRQHGLMEVTPVQALLLFRIGDRELTASEITSRGCYHGTNISYTLGKLVEGDFLRQRPNTADGRSMLISLTDRGRIIRDVIAALFERHTDEMDAGRLDHRQLEALAGTLRSLERFWTERHLHERW